MKATIKDLTSYKETVEKVFQMAKEYQDDLEKFKDYNFFKFYCLVRSLPYVRDPIGKETLSRPLYTLNENWKGSRDCDDKTILLVAKAIQDKKPVRAIVCGKNDRPHHIYPEIELNGNWIPVDATYPERSVLGKYLYNEKFREVFYP